jgi:hypothetical protein
MLSLMMGLEFEELREDRSFDTFFLVSFFGLRTGWTLDWTGLERLPLVFFFVMIVCHVTQPNIFYFFEVYITLLGLIQEDLVRPYSIDVEETIISSGELCMFWCVSFEPAFFVSLGWCDGERWIRNMS